MRVASLLLLLSLAGRLSAETLPQQLGTWRTPASPNSGDNQSAAEVPLVDAGGYYAATNVETALAELWTAYLVIRPGTVSQLGACVDGSPRTTWVVDAASPTDCAIGLGTLDVQCRCQDGSWTATASADDVPEAGDFGALALTGDVTSTGLATTIAANAVALGTDTTGGYAASTTEGGPATTATALAANGANCDPGDAAGGTDTTGAAEDCTTYVQPGAITTSGLTVATSKLLGRTTASPGAIEEIAVGDGLLLTGGELSATGGGSIGGSTGGADNAVLCSDGTGGATLQACNAASVLGGPLQVGAGSTSAAGIGVGDADTGLYSVTPGQLEVISNGATLAYIGYGALSRWDFTATLFRIAGSGAISQDPQASPPGSPTLGMTYTDSSSAYCWYDGASWQVVKGAGTCD